MGRGTVPPDSPEFLNRSRREALKQIDCIILAGTLLDFRMRFGQTIPADAKIIQLDMDATQIGQNRQADVPLVGNLACTFDLLAAVAALARFPESSAFRTPVTDSRSSLEKNDSDTKDSMCL